MPRANRFFVPGQIWHLTHRCHSRDFLLKFLRDRRRWRHWLFEARKRFDLCVLDYIVTSNHVHLLVKDRGRGEIASSMQLIAGRTGQEYNLRKQRRGAFWEDRYHATAVDRDEHLARCMVYIDLNMVRAHAVAHPAQWEVSGYREIQQPPTRYRIIDLEELQRLLDMKSLEQLRLSHARWIEEALLEAPGRRDPVWTECLAVGEREFIDRFKSQSVTKTRHRATEKQGGRHLLRELPSAYGENIKRKMVGLSGENRLLWDVLPSNS